MNQRKRKIFNILALLMVISMLAATVSAQPSRNGTAKQPEFTAAEAVEVVPASNTSRVIGEIKGATGLADYIVMLESAPVAFYRGEVDGLEATNAAALGQTKLDVNSDASRAYVDYLEAEHATFVSKLDAQTGREVELVFDYYYAFNGMAVTLTPSEAAAALTLPGVRQIQRDYDSYIDTDAGPAWIGADHVWDGSATGGFGATQGEGVIAGILDTGQNMDHPSFADIGGDGYDHTNPFGSGNYVGLCDSAPGTWVCNDKLIGYWIMTGETTEDTDGHGSHTASTTAGNHLTTTMMISASIEVEPARFVDTINTYQYRSHISGVAPHANIIGYDVCNDIGGCPNAGSVAAIDQAILDGVDVINFSIGGGASNPWTDSTAMAFLGAYEAGIVPVTSAGNSGPGAGTIGSPNNAPWMLAVGANFHNRAFPNAVMNMTGGDTTPPADISGAGFASGYGPAPIVYAEDAGDAQCLTPFAAGTWTNNEIVVCDRGTIARVQKGVNALAGGAGGFILANSSASQTLNGDPHALPAVHITYDDGVALKTWLATGAGHMATIQGSVVNTDPSNGDQMAGFSSRGPNTALLDIIKPDVTAPGVDILAAYKTNSVVADDFQQEFGIVSGTSMASPHTAGAAALMRALHPDWSVAEIIAALVATGDPEFYKEDDSTPADPFDLGGGQVDLTRAGRTNLTLDETAADFLAANPASGGDPKSLNIATMANSQCLNECTWTRTLASTVDWSMMYDTSASGENGLVVTVEPANFVIPAFGSQVITITADVSSIGSPGVWTFGSVYIEEVPQEGEELYGIRLPVAVVGTASIVPEWIDIDTRRNAGSQLEAGVQGDEITDFTVDNYGLVLGTVVEELLPQDPTDDDPYDSTEGTFFVTVTVPADTFRLVAETTESTAVDLDLFVGTGDTPSAATEICSSTTSSYFEYCDVGEPAAGTYWILVQNWLAGTSPPDTAVLSYAVVTETDAGNMMVTGPTTNPAGEPFDVRIFWDTPSMMYGDHWYGGFAMGTSAGTVGDLGSVPVDIIRWEDDVAKEPSSATALLGDTVTYTITVQPNITPEDLTYWITDTIPAGMTYVTDSATASWGDVDVTSGVLTWTGPMPIPGYTYEVETSVTDPAGCIMPLATGGAYVDLEQYGILTQGGISGDSTTWSVDFNGGEFIFFGEYYGETTYFTDDGFAFYDPSTAGDEPWDYMPIPTAAEPNNLMAILWNDFVVVYDAQLNRGVSLANLSTGGVPTAGIIEFDDVEPWPAGGSSERFDFEVLMRYDEDPTWYETIFAYDNLSGTVGLGTIGLENWLGNAGVQYAYDDISVVDEMAVCFDMVEAGGEEAVITFEVTVDQDASCPATITNTVY
ncbi:MAG TPA: S8 family serine peptidase, partial [candidate division Zixibacteria bacterium]|nr:S8 family serine peptidase [candidate division Zixibacteria bacterium]